MRRKPLYSSDGLTKGAWNAHEDKLLISYINAHGEGKWSSVPQKAGLKRCGKSCRLRWLNYLRPNIKHGNISEEEEDLIVRLHKLVGNRWSLIAGRLPGRTDNEIKNYWNTILGKKLRNEQLRTSVVAKASPSSSPPPKNDQTTVLIRPKPINYTKSYLTSFQKLPSPTHDEAVEPEVASHKTVEEKNNNASVEDWCFDIDLDYWNDAMMFNELDLDGWI